MLFDFFLVFLLSIYCTLYRL